MTVVEHIAVVEGMADTEFNTDIGSEDTPTHINTDQTTTIAALSVAVSFPNVKTRGELIHPVDTVLLTKDGGRKVYDGQVDTAILTKDGGSEDHNCPADQYKELCNLLIKDWRHDGDLYADELARLWISQLDSDNIDNYIGRTDCTDTTPAPTTDIGASEAGESIDPGTTDYLDIAKPFMINDFEETSQNESDRLLFVNDFPEAFGSINFQCEFDLQYELQYEFEPYMKPSFDNIDPELSLTAPDAFHAHEFDFDPQILTTGPEAFRAYDHSLDETIDYTAHVRAGVT